MSRAYLPTTPGPLLLLKNKEKKKYTCRCTNRTKRSGGLSVETDGLTKGNATVPRVLYAATVTWPKSRMHMRGSRNFLRGDPTLTTFFFSWREKPLKAGYYRPASKTPLKWRFAGMPMMAQHWILAWLLRDFSGGSGPVFAKKPYILVIFQWGGGRILCPLWIRPWCTIDKTSCLWLLNLQNMIMLLYHTFFMRRLLHD